MGGFVLVLPGVFVAMLFAVVFEALHLQVIVGVLLGVVIGAIIGTFVLHVIIAGILRLWWKAHETRWFCCCCDGVCRVTL